MGILKTISSDIEDLVKMGYNDKEISVSVGMDKTVIQYMIDYVRNHLDEEDRNYNKQKK